MVKNHDSGTEDPEQKFKIEGGAETAEEQQSRIIQNILTLEESMDQVKIMQDRFSIQGQFRNTFLPTIQAWRRLLYKAVEAGLIESDKVKEAIRKENWGSEPYKEKRIKD